MKKRILSLLLVLCLIVGMLPMVVLAADPTAALTVTTGNNDAVTQWKPAMSVGMVPSYAKTTPEGALDLENATATDYNLKAEWPIGGNPTLTLNNATLKNDTINPDDKDGIEHTVYNVVQITGTADFKIQLVGTNVFNTNHASGDTTTSSGRVPSGIYATNTASVTISSQDKTVDTLLIDGAGGTGIYKGYGNLLLDSANVTIYMRNTGTNNQYGIAMAYGTSGYVDKTNLTVSGSILTIKGTGRYYGNVGIILGKGGGYASDNTSDILFKNSKINLSRNNGTSANSDGAEFIQYGVNSTFKIDSCDFEVYGNHRTVKYVPEFINCTNVQHRTGWEKWSDFALTPGASLFTNTNNSAFKATHVCVPGEPVLGTTVDGTCTKLITTTTYCATCGVQMSYQTETTDEKVHTPGAKVEVDQDPSKDGIQRTNATNVAGYSANGKYIFETTCSVCGEKETIEEAFGPALLHYATASSDITTETSNGVTKKVQATNRRTWDNTGNTSSSYNSINLLNPGGSTIYFTTPSGGNTLYPDNSHLTRLTDPTKIANNEWTVKLEYPLYGTPVLTLKGANINNCSGIWYGLGGRMTSAPLKVIIAEDSSITQTSTGTTLAASLCFRTTGDVTITGPGKLTIKSTVREQCVIKSHGNLILDHANIEISRMIEGSSSSPSPMQADGNITIKGGSLNILAANSTYTAFAQGIRATGDITIEDGANVQFFATLANNDSGALKAGGNVTIANSAVTLASAQKIGTSATVKSFTGNAIICGGNVTLDYAAGFVAHGVDSRAIYDMSTTPATMTIPTANTYTNAAQITSTVLGYLYFDIAPSQAQETFAGTNIALKDSLDVNFAISTDKITAGNAVKFTIGDKSIVQTLSDSTLKEEKGYTILTLPDVAAKEFADPITVTVLDKNGKAITETKTDSAKDYAMRMIRSDSVDGHNAEELAALKTLLVDTLIYASMAQVQFNHNTDNLATADLTPAEWAMASGTVEYPEETAAKTENEGYMGTSFILENNIRMAIAVSKRVVGEGATATATFTNNDGTEITAKLTIDEEYSGKGAYVFITNDLVAADGQCPVTFRVYKDGEETPIITVTDSMLNYVGRMVAKYPYLEEMIKYCNSAKAYFDLKNAVTPTE